MTPMALRVIPGWLLPVVMLSVGARGRVLLTTAGGS